MEYLKLLEMVQQTREYLKDTPWVPPPTHDCAAFMVTEAAEFLDAWQLRPKTYGRAREKLLAWREELADTMIMWASWLNTYDVLSERPSLRIKNLRSSIQTGTLYPLHSNTNAVDVLIASVANCYINYGVPQISSVGRVYAAARYLYGSDSELLAETNLKLAKIGARYRPTLVTELDS